MEDNFKSFLDVEKSFSLDDSIDNDDKTIIELNGTCTKCNEYSIIVDSDLGIIVCSNPYCGKFIDDIMDSGQEWRSLSTSDASNANRCRVGLPVNEHFTKASLSTIILGYGHEIFRKYQLYNSMDYDERRLLKNFQLIDDNTESKNIPESVKDHAKNMFKTISIDQNKRGSCKHSNMAACVYFASKDKDLKQSKEKLSKCFNIKKKKFTKGCNFYKEEMFEKEPEYYKKLKPINTNDEIDKFGDILKMTELYKNISKYVGYMSTELGILLKNTPTSIAVGSIYMVSQVYNLNILKKDISELCEVSDVTINKAYNAMINYQDILIPTKRLFEEFIRININ